MTHDAGTSWSPVFSGHQDILERRSERLDAARLAGRPSWRRRYAVLNAGLDAIVAVAAGAVADLTTLTITEGSAEDIGVPMTVSVAAFVALWLAVQSVGGTYDEHHLSVGSEEYRRVMNGGVRAFALIAAVAFLGEVDLPRTFLVVAIPAATALSIVHRHVGRQWVNRRRTQGRFSEDILVVGAVENSVQLVRHLRRASHAGYRVVGVVVQGGFLALDVDGEPVPVLGEPANLEEVLLNTQADSVAVTDTDVLRGGLQRLAWRLEGTGIDLLVVPALTDVAGPRIGIRPAAGLPLLHVEEPELRGSRRLGKEAFDRVVALLALVVLSPVLLAIAIAVRTHSPGPAFYRQTRVGRDGRRFTMWKFRTMRLDADEEKPGLRHLNSASGALFKIPEDPRRTTVGKWLRRYSVDELPQLLNVLIGHMSLVGPRPPVPSEVSEYRDGVHRRLLVKPGMTGLWQVSGRSDLSWDESIRLDLYYVENWSLALDLTLMWKTIAAVTSGRGAY